MNDFKLVLSQIVSFNMLFDCFCLCKMNCVCKFEALACEFGGFIFGENGMCTKLGGN